VRVVAYVRTSWEEQSRGDHPSTGEQESDLREFASRTGLELVRCESDTGLGPNHGTCAGLVSLLDDMEGAWEAVIVTSLCRLTRNPTLSIDAIEELRQNGKAVFVADEKTGAELARRVRRRAPRKPARPEAAAGGGEPGAPGGKRRRIAERLLKGREAGARAGKHQSGPAPFGYRRDYSRRSTDGVLLVPDEEESEVVKLIFREYLRLRSMKRLIKLLDDKGLKTRRGKRWSRAGVSWILKNDTYVGRVHFGKIRSKGRHESIVPPIVFNKVQKLIRENNKRKGGGKRTTQTTAPERALDAAERKRAAG